VGASENNLRQLACGGAEKHSAAIKPTVRILYIAWIASPTARPCGAAYHSGLNQERSLFGVIPRKLILDLVRLPFAQSNSLTAVVHRWAFALPVPDNEAPGASSNREARERWLVVRAYFTTFNP
jgi:hypothetical protein